MKKKPKARVKRAVAPIFVRLVVSPAKPGKTFDTLYALDMEGRIWTCEAFYKGVNTGIRGEDGWRRLSNVVARLKGDF